MRFLPSLLLLPFVLTVFAAGEPGSLPEAETGALYQRAKSQPRDRAERVALNASIIADARKCLDAHADVPPAAPSRDILVRRVMLPAAERLFGDAPTPENREQLRAIATEVTTSAIYEGHLVDAEKPRAGLILARLAIFPNADGKPVDAANHIRAFIARFPVRPELKNPDAMHGQALVFATQLAAEAKEQALVDELCPEIAAKHLTARGAIDILGALGHPVLFESELTSLDGKKISFPQDTKGKIVLLDFWATWCAPCRASLPHIREIHEKYKDRGVLVIGVSCDSPQAGETKEANKRKVADLVAKDKLVWTQTWSGEWPAPAVKYGVGSIPTVFLIGKDGRIVSTSARGREAQLIEAELARNAG